MASWNSMNPPNIEPEFDMDGTRFHHEPTEQEIAEYEAYQRQSAEWTVAGLCMGCGAPPPLWALHCASCMDGYCEAMSGK